jgi:hypothetical protein
MAFSGAQKTPQKSMTPAGSDSIQAEKAAGTLIRPFGAYIMEELYRGSR